jgi:serine/threonine-protein kinase
MLGSANDDDEVRLVGFGFAGAEPVSGEAWTWTNVVGRRELGLGDPAIDAGEDVYRLGCILYELVTGSRPTRACSGARTSQNLRKHLAGQDDESSEAMRKLRAIIVRAIDELPGRRFSSARELGDALRRLLRHYEPPRDAAPARRPIAALVVLTVILASIAAATGFWYARLATALPLLRQ